MTPPRRYLALAYVCRPQCIRRGLANEGFAPLWHLFQRRPQGCRWVIVALSEDKYAAIDLFAVQVVAGVRVTIDARDIHQFATQDAAETYAILEYDRDHTTQRTAP